jgi:Ulp1 family protease
MALRTYYGRDDLDISDVVDVQQQPDSNSCGLFVIAYAHCLYNDEDPVMFKFDVPEMRMHLLSGLLSGEITAFPRMNIQ